MQLLLNNSDMHLLDARVEKRFPNGVTRLFRQFSRFLKTLESCVIGEQQPSQWAHDDTDHFCSNKKSSIEVMRWGCNKLSEFFIHESYYPQRSRQ